MPKTKLFIEKSRAAHGDKYDYSLSKYTTAKAKVTVICPTHGNFELAARRHYGGQGCQACIGRKRLTPESYIERAKEKHGDRYDYSLTRFVNQKTKVTIICKEHGEFKQAPASHLNTGRGCPTCGGSEKLNNKSFTKKARELHLCRYDYSLVNYVNAITKVKIICATHGVFNQTPNKHLTGRGCHKCAGNIRSNTEAFKAKAIQVHGDRYGYGDVEYVSTHSRVSIHCFEHGPFNQSPNLHLKGHRCPACSGVKKRTTETFITRAKETHGNKYDYSQVNYINKSSKVTIVCGEHGAFNQEAGAHMQGQGCPSCAWDRSQPSDVYLLTNGELVKVGISIDTERRVRQLNRAQPFTADLVSAWRLPSFDEAHTVEQQVHEALSEYSHSFISEFDGSTEWFKVTPAYAADVIKQAIDKREDKPKK